MICNHVGRKVYGRRETDGDPNAVLPSSQASASASQRAVAAAQFEAPRVGRELGSVTPPSSSRIARPTSIEEFS